MKRNIQYISYDVDVQSIRGNKFFYLYKWKKETKVFIKFIK